MINTRFSEIANKVVEWGDSKNITDPKKQYLKFLEEVGETAKAVLKLDTTEIIDGIGDIAVTMIILNHQLNNESINDISHEIAINEYKCSSINEVLLNTSDLYEYNAPLRSFVALAQYSSYLDFDLVDCLESAWDVIKNRTGKTVDNLFIKD